ncbi:hypothetical protein JD844_015149 [Phrynosoma platyrhinos]|uniref:Carbohydrate deacetylase n=1 Tax=Phrynosoma platyrhinos TaxID=52577 RepID=A0ABQ7T759_PHRPL|nr:hypothetical protein JD844_015149 [Phrynosoma platyrhinos]
MTPNKLEENHTSAAVDQKGNVGDGAGEETLRNASVSSRAVAKVVSRDYELHRRLGHHWESALRAQSQDKKREGQVRSSSQAPEMTRADRRHRIPIGLHANLSEGSPVCPALKEKSSLLNAEGFFHGKMGIRTALAEGCLNLSEVRRKRCPGCPSPFKAACGWHDGNVMIFATTLMPVEFLASIDDQGESFLSAMKEIRHVFAQVLEEYGIRYTRIPIEPDLPRCDWIDPPLMAFYRSVEKDSLDTVEVFRKHHIRWPDIYIGLSTMGKNMSLVKILGAIDNATAAYLAKETPAVPRSSSLGSDPEAKSVTIELMTHPGYPSILPVGGCGEGPDDFSQSWERLHELETLKNPELQRHYKARNIELCAFRHLEM